MYDLKIINMNLRRDISGEKIILVFIADTHFTIPQQLRKILESKPDIKNIAYFQEHYHGPISGSKPRKDQYYDWCEIHKIPSDKNVLIFPCGPASGTYDGPQGDLLYINFFSKLLENADLKLENFDAFIISTGHSYPIATCLLPIYDFSKSIKIYDLHPFQVYNCMDRELKNKPVIIRPRHEKFKELIYNHEPFEIKNLLTNIGE